MMCRIPSSRSVDERKAPTSCTGRGCGTIEEGWRTAISEQWDDGTHPRQNGLPYPGDVSLRRPQPSPRPTEPRSRGSLRQHDHEQGAEKIGQNTAMSWLDIRSGSDLRFSRSIGISRVWGNASTSRNARQDRLATGNKKACSSILRQARLAKLVNGCSGQRDPTRTPY
jgi:hypothetical protein